MADDFRSGIKSTAFIGATELPTTGWSTDSSVDIVNFRNSKTNKFGKSESTYRSSTFEIRIEYDFDANPWTAAVDILPGSKLTNVKLYLDESETDQFWSYPSATVVGTPQTVETEGKITTTVRAQNDGPFYPPGVIAWPGDVV